MRCDERSTALTMRQEPAAEAPPPEVCLARLVRITGCPARPGYRELHFDVAGTPWSWCFPGTAQAGDSDRPVRLLIFRPGPHGIAVQAVTGEAGGLIQPATFDLASAADLAISGMPVFVHRFLLRQETGPARSGAGPGPQPIELGRK